MLKKNLLLMLFTTTTFFVLYAQDDIPITSEESIDLYYILAITITVMHVLALLFSYFLIIYTNRREKIYFSNSDNQDELQIIEGLSEEERNARAAQILMKIEEKLTPISDEGGNDFITITKGRQAKFMKRGLDYINKRLAPTDEDILSRVHEFSDVYLNRAKRVFMGSKWIIGCAIVATIYFIISNSDNNISKGLYIFLFQLIGISYYYFSSKVPIYLAERRETYYKIINLGIIRAVITGLFSTVGTRLTQDEKHYVKEENGTWERDYKSELESSFFSLLISIIIKGAMLMLIFFLVLAVAILILPFGILNFLTNYSTTLLWPFHSEEKWYDKNFSSEVQEPELETELA